MLKFIFTSVTFASCGNVCANGNCLLKVESPTENPNTHSTPHPIATFPEPPSPDKSSSNYSFSEFNPSYNLVNDSSMWPFDNTTFELAVNDHEKGKDGSRAVTRPVEVSKRHSYKSLGTIYPKHVHFAAEEEEAPKHVHFAELVNFTYLPTSDFQNVESPLDPTFTFTPSPDRTNHDHIAATSKVTRRSNLHLPKHVHFLNRVDVLYLPDMIHDDHQGSGANTSRTKDRSSRF
jgi:hypothetical protein